MVLQINEAVSDEARMIHEQSVVIDTCTFFLETYNWQLHASGATAINCTVPLTLDSAGEAFGRIADYYETIRYEPQLVLIEKADDILRAKKEGKIGVIIGAQSCEFVQHGDLFSSTQLFAKMGLRIMQIAYSHRSFAADGCLTGDDAGLTNDGKILIKAMEKAGIIVDLSHVGRRSTLEAMETCEKPPIFSHSNPDSLFPHPRNLTDEQAKRLAAKGGVIGVCAFPPLCWDGEKYPSIDSFVNAIAYYADLIGIDHIGIGLDSNAQPGAYNRRELLRFGWLVNQMENTGTASNYYGASFAAGRGLQTLFCEDLVNIANLINITNRMLERGFSKDAVEKVLGLNYMRVFREWWG
jgi:membrane dipeptidase